MRAELSVYHEFDLMRNSTIPVDDSMIMPGEHGQVRLTLFKKMVMTNGQQFTIRENNKTVATGIITQSHKPVELPLNKLSKLVLNI